MINTYVMRSPTNKPTEKAIKRITNEKTSSTNTPILNNKVPVNPQNIVEIDINKLLKSMINEEISQDTYTMNATKSLSTEQDIQTLKQILAEYFDSFMVLGYGINGNRIIIRYTKTDKDEDSLLEMLRHVFMRTIQDIQ